jgi:hypothetical protein
MQFDTADLASMEQRGILNDVITHEMGHVLGCVGFIWEQKGLVTGQGTEAWAFTGLSAMAEYGKLLDPCSPAVDAVGAPKPVPIENQHGPGTRGSHWRETVFGSELMTGFVSQSGSNLLSRVTAGMFRDLGYVVDDDHTDEFTLPGHLELAEMGLLAAAFDYESLGVVLPTVPLIASDESLVIASDQNMELGSVQEQLADITARVRRMEARAGLSR